MINRQTFRQLYQEHFDALFFFACKLLKDRDLAKDTVQEVFLKFWIHRERIKLNYQPKAYLFQSLKNKSLNVIRNHKRKILAEYQRIKSHEALLTQASDLVLEQELSEILMVAINKLPKRKRRIYKLKIFGGFSSQEIADKMGISCNTVNLQVSRATKDIKEYLNSIYPEYAFPTLN